MTTREIRLAPDGDSAAIRGDLPDTSPRAWGYANAYNGGGAVGAAMVESWPVAVIVDAHDPARGQEVRVSPDGDKVAVRGEAPDDDTMAWITYCPIGSIGGEWVATAAVADWPVLGIAPHAPAEEAPSE
ncbi:hypothetical protein BCA37_10830 [Mycobacterium sp. djl-10]|nr:hypothetical protein BCA37_10830 [Mycobacterium sp. djl-10]